MVLALFWGPPGTFQVYAPFQSTIPLLSGQYTIERNLNLLSTMKNKNCNLPDGV